MLRLRGGAPEELDDDEAFYEPGQVAQPVTAIGAPSGEVYMPQVQQATAQVTLLQQGVTATDHFAEMLMETHEDVVIA